MADIWYRASSTEGQLFDSRQLEDMKKQEIERESVLCLYTDLKAIFKMDEINRKTIDFSVIH